jgi:hypothetical protein
MNWAHSGEMSSGMELEPIGGLAIRQCRPTELDAWRDCIAPHCNNEKRINPNVDPLVRLEHYKVMVEAEGKLGELEQADLQVITDGVVQAITAFLDALQEMIEPALEVVARALRTFWEGLPEDVRATLRQETEPPLRTQLKFDTTAFAEGNAAHKAILDGQLGRVAQFNREMR